MIARWDALLLAAILSGGSMLIESSHRIDTGATDDALTAWSASACPDGPVSGPINTTNDDVGADAWLTLNPASDDATPAGCD